MAIVNKIFSRVLRVCYRLFSFLADKSKGWALFVKPKLLIGSMLVGMVVTSCKFEEVSCYLPARPPTDTIPAATAPTQNEDN
ncbi:MAG: hypothetical protein LBT48_00765 [Prevotellaceae bacterium]|jgi:hypothetical protein|nr:hypothetical protein [Prevotellaceae bacterium]